MQDKIEFDGRQISASDLTAQGKPTSWPDIFSTRINGSELRWQYANEKGPCAAPAADRVQIPFAHGKIPKNTSLRLKRAVPV